MSPAHFVLGGALILTVVVGIAVAPRAIEKLEDWAAERKERRRQREEASAAKEEGAHLMVIGRSAEVMRASARRRDSAGEGEEGRGLRYRHRVSTGHERVSG